MIKPATDKIYYNTYIIGIVDVLVKLISCHGFSRNVQSINILTCHNKLVLYYLSKFCLILESNSNESNKFQSEVQNIVHLINKHPSEFVLLCNRTIPPYYKTMARIYLNPKTSHELRYNYFYSHADQFQALFK